MTILDAIKIVLHNDEDGLTTKEIYNKIIENNLYNFRAQKPINVVDVEIKRRCIGITYNSSHPTKVFEICGYNNKFPRFRIISNEIINPLINKKDDEKHISKMLPEGKIQYAIDQHLEVIKRQLYEHIMANTPAFFEHLVIDLLLKMGYGYDENSGFVTGKSHDGGIDGIINEDKLGLNLIYIQAKRYSKGNTIGRHELQAFVGAMENIKKGVFITTSSFTKEAKEFINKQQQKNIKLIDGEYLIGLLIKYEIGISVIQTFNLYRLNYDYFN